MLCEHGYKADAEAFIKIESDHLAKGYEASDDWRPSLKEQVDYLQKFLVTRTSV